MTIFANWFDTTKLQKHRKPSPVGCLTKYTKTDRKRVEPKIRGKKENLNLFLIERIFCRREFQMKARVL